MRGIVTKTNLRKLAGILDAGRLCPEPLSGSD
jgi:hypothetical protein